jgi:hypothetical protein
MGRRVRDAAVSFSLPASKQRCCLLRDPWQARGGFEPMGGIRPLESGMLCHVPAKTPHDFAALDEEMLLLYILIDQPPA